MKALGIPQPGAWLIINGYHSTVPLPKRTSYRGDVIIYALPELITQEAYQWFLDGCRQLKISSYPRLSGFDYSGFLGTAKIVECEISESGDALAILEEPTELGYVESKGELGIFDVSEDPFPIISNSKPGYSSTPSSSFKSRASSYSWPATAYDIDDESNEPSLLGHVITGVEQQAKRELNKVGRNLAKGAFEVGADLLGSWLGGGKPRRR